MAEANYFCVKKKAYFITFPLFLGGMLGFLILPFFCLADQTTTSVTVIPPVCGNSIKEIGEQCDSDNLGSKSCADLGYDGGTLSCSASCGFNTLNCATNAETTAILLFTPSSESTYTMINEDVSAKITLPKDFYVQDLRLQMFSYEPSVIELEKPAPLEKSFVGKVYNFVFIDSNGATVSALSQPATLILTYTDADIVGVDENTLAPYHSEAGDSAWQLISGAVIDTVRKQVTFTTANFSSFVLIAFGAPLPSTPFCGDGSCNGSELCSTCPADCGNCPVVSSSGGGGGEYVYVAPVTGVIFSGQAYPNAIVTLLKDAQVAATTVASADANFSISISGLSAGNYIFSVYSEDNNGMRSSLLPFSVSVTSGTITNMSGIFIAPTIAVDKSEVKYGDNIAIFGQSVPNGEITIVVNSDQEFLRTIIADKNGAYLYNFDTTLLDMGWYFTKSKVALNDTISSFGQVISFVVGTKTILAKSTTSVKGDLNGDSRINLIDFSIMAYWYKRPVPPTFVDLNGDKKIDLIDFSIMAYYWTG